MNYSPLFKFPVQALRACKCSEPVRGLKFVAAFAYLCLWLMLLAYVPANAAIKETTVLTFYKTGKTLKFRASDIVSNKIDPYKYNSELSSLVIEMTPAMIQRAAAFMSAMFDHKIVGFINGRVFFSGTKVDEIGAARMIHFGTYETSFIQGHSTHLDNLRNDAQRRDQLFMVMFEMISELTIERSEIGSVDFDGDAVKIQFDLPIRHKPDDFASIEQQNDWQLALDDWVIESWRFTITDGLGQLTVQNLDPKTTDALRTLSSKIQSR